MDRFNSDQSRRGKDGYIDAAQARRLAKRRLPRMMFDFVDGSTGTECTDRLNRRALQDIKLVSRILVDIQTIDLSTQLLGRTYDVPFGIAPMGMCNLIWPDSDAAISLEAKQRNLPHCVSTAASTTIEALQQATGGSVWFQLYAGTNGSATEELIERAGRAGCETLVFTADTPKLARRNRDQQNGFRLPFQFGPKQFLDFALHPRWSVSSLMAGVPKPMNFETSSNGASFVREDSRGGADWAFLDALRKRWGGMLVVKGVMSADDALRVRDAGADAVYVSNHGGRQLDSAPAAITALPLIRDAVGKDYPLIFDSGIRSADDIVRALALGADFIMLGRPILYALGGAGGHGLASYLDCLEDDLKTVLAQIGKTAIGQIDSSVLTDPTNGSKDE